MSAVEVVKELREAILEDSPVSDSCLLIGAVRIIEQLDEQVEELRRERLIVGPKIVPAVVDLLDGDRLPDNWDIGPERDEAIDRLLDALKAGEALDLAAPRSSAAAEHDGGGRTTAGYLSALVRDRFVTGDLGDWDQFLAIGSLAAMLIEQNQGTGRTLLDVGAAVSPA